jgi:hypothetical protein
MWFSQMQQNHISELIFCDETDYNLWTKRNRGQSRIGCRATVRISGNRGARVSLIAGISPQRGLVFHSMYAKSKSSVEVISFIEGLMGTSPLQSKVLLIWDNVPPHKPHSVQEYIRTFGNRLEVRCLPPWSPFLNPIEEAKASEYTRYF